MTKDFGIRTRIAFYRTIKLNRNQVLMALIDWVKSGWAKDTFPLYKSYRELHHPFAFKIPGEEAIDWQKMADKGAENFLYDYDNPPHKTHEWRSGCYCPYCTWMAPGSQLFVGSPVLLSPCCQPSDTYPPDTHQNLVRKNGDSDEDEDDDNDIPRSKKRRVNSPNPPIPFISFVNSEDHTFDDLNKDLFDLNAHDS